MYITAGKYKRRKLFALEGQELTRPTSNKLRQQVFNICQNSIENALFCDICAGTGAMGLEALSRGAKRSIFIDSSKTACDIISKNIESLGAEKESRVICTNAVSALKKLVEEKCCLDICYIDPPYAEKELLAEIIVFLDEHPELLNSGAEVFVEAADVSLNTLTLKNLVLESDRRSGGCVLYVFRV